MDKPGLTPAQLKRRAASKRARVARKISRRTRNGQHL